MATKFDWGMAAATHLAIQGDADDLADVWSWAWKHYGDNALYTEWGNGFYTGLRLSGFTIEGPRAYLED